MIWGKHIYTSAHAHKIKNMFVIENYMHIEHTHKMYRLPEAAQHRLEQHMDRDIYIYL